MARVDEQFGRRKRDEHLWLAGVHGDVAAALPLLAQHLRERVRIGERLAENQSAPTEFEDYIIGHRVDHVLRRRVVQAECDGLGVILAGIDEAGCRRPTGSGGHAAAPVMPWR